jgi:hypothetical protein
MSCYRNKVEDIVRDKSTESQLESIIDRQTGRIWSGQGNLYLDLY